MSGEMSKEVEDALGMNRCQFCDSNDTTTLKSGSDGIQVKIRVCQRHYEAAMNAFVNMFGGASSRDIWQETSECEHSEMVPDEEQAMSDGMTGHGFVCSDCGFRTMTPVLEQPSDTEIDARLRGIFARWASD